MPPPLFETIFSNISAAFPLERTFSNFDSASNKLFDILALLYIKKKYNCDIYIVEKDTIHTQLFDKKISDVFINLKNDIFFINEDEMKKIELIPNINIMRINKFKNF